MLQFIDAPRCGEAAEPRRRESHRRHVKAGGQRSRGAAGGVRRREGDVVRLQEMAQHACVERLKYVENTVSSLASKLSQELTPTAQPPLSTSGPPELP